jgi:tRNA (guanine-N7-)-methyltransferase
MSTESNLPAAGIPSLSPNYLAVLDERRRVLQEELSRILPPGAAFVWEVGSGHGHFLAAYAAAHPERLCIGVDLASERIERALRKRDRARLNNLHFIRAEARFFLQCLPPGPLISDLFVLFPDPWPKLRHHKHRLLQAGFLIAAADAARPDCRLHFRTDFRPYFDEACNAIRASTRWNLMPAATPWPFEFSTVFQNRAAQHDSLIARRQPVD